MVTAVRKRRLTKAEALEQARRQVTQPRPKPRRPARDEGEEGPSRGRERWISLPPHLMSYIGEEAVICDGFIWTHRRDRKPYEATADGTKRFKVRPVCLGPVAQLDPDSCPPVIAEKGGSGNPDARSIKSPFSVSGEKATRPSDRLSPEQGTFDTLLGRPKKTKFDVRILALAGEGMGARTIARIINREANDAVISFNTVARRLKDLSREANAQEVL